MSFVGAIDSESHISAWSKTITSLAALSDSIHFQIKPSSIALSSINCTRTALSEVVFPLTKFHEFSATLNNNENAYTFFVNSRPLLILFKHLDTSDLQYVCFKVMWLDDCPTQLAQKLLIEIKTKKLIVKKYQTSYQESDNLAGTSDMHQMFKKLRQPVFSGNSYHENEFNTMNLDWIVLKQFLDVIPTATEDFKIERNHEKLVLSGYTRQVVREREILKQPMFVSISLAIDEINECKLNPEMPLINFGIREFKVFTSLVSNLAENKSDSQNPQVQVIFSNPGDHIWFVFETDTYILLYLLVTGGDGAFIQGNGAKLLQPFKIREKSERTEINGSKRLEAFSETVMKQLALSLNQTCTLDLPLLGKSHREREGPNKRTRYNHLTTDQLHADTDFGESSEETDEEDFGPTQGVSVPRSIFDEGDHGGL